MKNYGRVEDEDLVVVLVRPVFFLLCHTFVHGSPRRFSCLCPSPLSSSVYPMLFMPNAIYFVLPHPTLLHPSMLRRTLPAFVLSNHSSSADHLV
ncbi:hypothetical protein FA13DRAFT_377613 [Coprinellus micaceus]|uniref:Uncharacterized protein n=1 Tax=Coprinellus micaceus TaxID=71717 RepID=A0A4Y7SCE9_COPMI|nr:hypothetical protein FA13DRAFT_377613 [Coprinellus micaceus]